MSKPARLFLCSAFAAGAMLSSVQAQETPGLEGCESEVIVGQQGGEEGEYFITAPFNSCAASGASRSQAIFVPAAVARAVRQSFGFGPASVEPAGLSGLIADEAEQRLSASGIVVTPAAGVAAGAATPYWNAWVTGRYQHSDYSDSAGDLDGPTWSGMGGVDYKLTSKFTLGLLVSGDSTNLENSFNDYESGSIGIGPYIGVVLTENLVFSANLLGSRIDSEQAGGLLQFDASRVQAAAGINGYWYRDTWRFAPGITVSWSKDSEEEANGLFPDRTIEVGILTPAVQIGNTLRISDTATVEPWLGAALDWTFLNDTHTDGFGTFSDTSTDLRLQAGLNFGLGSNAQLAVTAEAGGLLLDDLNTYAIEANLAVQF